jgi:Fe-S-cluster containining protein
MMERVDIKDIPFPLSPVVPTLLESTATIQFRCHKGIACFNACCKNIDITLTPYDVLRLKGRLGLTSGEFLVKYTTPFEMGQGDIAGIKMLPAENSTQCQFMNDEGCSVYEDRPTACRYYPAALLSLRNQNEYTDREAYALVKEDHCLGHNEPRTLTIAEYRTEQGVEEYDEQSRGWRQLILKKKSTGPTVGKPSKRSLQLFFMACYDLDRFREFVDSASFNEVYDLPGELRERIRNDETELLQFGYSFLRQVMFDEASIPLKADALDKRLARKQEREAVMDEIAAKLGPLDTQPAEEFDKYKFVD